MLKKIGFLMCALVTLAVLSLYLIRPQANSNTPLIHMKSQTGIEKPQTIISDTELAALNVHKPAST